MNTLFIDVAVLVVVLMVEARVTIGVEVGVDVDAKFDVESCLLLPVAFCVDPGDNIGYIPAPLSGNLVSVTSNGGGPCLFDMRAATGTGAEIEKAEVVASGALDDGESNEGPASGRCCRG